MALGWFSGHSTASSATRSEYRPRRGGGEGREGRGLAAGGDEPVAYGPGLVLGALHGELGHEVRVSAATGGGTDDRRAKSTTLDPGGRGHREPAGGGRAQPR